MAATTRKDEDKDKRQLAGRTQREDKGTTIKKEDKDN
jgi:hypothetical protein